MLTLGHFGLPELLLKSRPSRPIEVLHGVVNSYCLNTVLVLNVY